MGIPVRFTTVMTALLIGSYAWAQTTGGPEIVVRANGVPRQDHPVEVTIAAATPFTGVVEVDGDGRIVDENVPFQRDAQGGLTFLLKGRTSADAARRYRLVSETTPRKDRPQVRVEDAEDEGQESFKITTPAGTYFYHKKGAGFSSLLDPDGADWLGFRPQGGSAGHYRGIPNLVHPEGYFHPGSTNCTTKAVHRGPIKATLESESRDGKWKCRWEIFPTFARLTVLACERPYWFLYEGTPGGKLDLETDYCVVSDGTRTPASKKWTGDLPAPEWLYFGDPRSKRVLFLAHHDDDDRVDSYWPMQGNMTVFGFGRDGLKKHLDRTPNRFTLGLRPETDHAATMSAIRAAVHPVKTRVIEQ